MSLDFFRIERGLDLDDSVQYLQGSGAPGLGGDTAAAPVGSVYTNNVNGDIWTKVSAGTGNDKWLRLASEQYVNNAMGATVSWREPARVRDNLATTVPSGTPGSPIVVDGVSIGAGQRVLFSAVTGGNGKNIYVYNQTTGTFAEDANAESSGDAVYVQAGSDAGKTYIFNGTDWVQSDQSALDEDGFIRAFIGKSSVGNELPGYSSTNVVSNGTSLETAIGALDGEIGVTNTGNYVTSANTVGQNLNALDAKIGAAVTGTHISAGDTVFQNLAALDAQIGPELVTSPFITAGDATNTAVQSLSNALGASPSTGAYITNGAPANQNIQALDSAIGSEAVITPSAGSVVSQANTVNQNLQALGEALAASTATFTENNVTSITTIDSVVGGAAKWLVRCEDALDSTRVYATEIYALSNGATVDFTRYGTLRIGTSIPGLVVSADFNAGAIRLRVAATSAVNVEARRVGTII